MFTRIISYLQESKLEFKRVNWPTRQETIKMTVMVIALSLMVAIFLGLLDTLFNSLLLKFI